MITALHSAPSLIHFTCRQIVSIYDHTTSCIPAKQEITVTIGVAPHNLSIFQKMWLITWRITFYSKALQQNIHAHIILKIIACNHYCSHTWEILIKCLQSLRKKNLLLNLISRHQQFWWLAFSLVLLTWSLSLHIVSIYLKGCVSPQLTSKLSRNCNKNIAFRWISHTMRRRFDDSLTQFHTIIEFSESLSLKYVPSVYVINMTINMQHL